VVKEQMLHVNPDADIIADICSLMLPVILVTKIIATGNQAGIKAYDSNPTMYRNTITCYVYINLIKKTWITTDTLPIKNSEVNYTRRICNQDFLMTIVGFS